jgi:hypothetical protein
MPPGPAGGCRPKRNGSSPTRAGLEGADYAWGDEFRLAGVAMALTFEGSFPGLFTSED